jgi:hypothetical protein
MHSFVVGPCRLAKFPQLQGSALTSQIPSPACTRLAKIPHWIFRPAEMPQKPVPWG